MKDVACTWRTTFMPIVTGDIEQETGFDDPEQVYLAHRANIEEGGQSVPGCLVYAILSPAHDVGFAYLG